MALHVVMREREKDNLHFATQNGNGEKNERVETSQT